LFQQQQREPSCRHRLPVGFCCYSIEQPVRCIGHVEQIRQDGQFLGRRLQSAVLDPAVVGLRHAESAGDFALCESAFFTQPREAEIEARATSSFPAGHPRYLQGARGAKDKRPARGVIHTRAPIARRCSKVGQSLVSHDHVGRELTARAFSVLPDVPGGRCHQRPSRIRQI
jgi:hypothetical protein